MASINETTKKIKEFVQSDLGKDIYIGSIIILVAFASFGLGRMSKSAENKENVQVMGITAEYTKQTSQPHSEQGTTSQAASAINISESNIIDQLGMIFASKRGKKYYLPGCSGGSTIKEENKIYFSTEGEAMNAGYEKSSTCK
ncbi:MAG: Endonuclease I [Candidatus Nomurabacteria bacterium GW2011_GWB1_37_5]|uniref:Endonuclease I n=1 Tax=Candidatus Nomurabacteria bacterium GW2011_GWB1_37_5 TaxID=1618742 RepID=A0A0G0GYZ1_9BACT|nr:MAG: Endonuclease I [Candidatus Nomurabacteria bacterium GW2011_GWB1_37_5]